MRTKNEQTKEAAISVIRAAFKKCKSTMVCREEIEVLTAGAISSRHLANLDCLGFGIPGAFKMGRRQVYPVDSVVEWLIGRLDA